MEDAHEFLKALTIILGVAAVTTVAFQRLRQPVVLGYILAGLIIGPHVPIPLVADRAVVQTLSEVGVILLMFSLGLEFSFRKLFRLAPTAGLTAVLQSSLMVWVGFVVGQLLGWTTVESLFLGAIIAISSTTIIAKAFEEQRVRGPLRELVIGVLIVEDLIAILLMAVLTAVASGRGLSASEMAATTGKLTAFLVGLVSIGLLVVPRAIRAVSRLGRPETTLVASVGLCFGIALLARDFGYSVALGAFIAGSLVAESGEQAQIEHLVQPVRDLFAAIFFVSVGVLIDPALVAQHWVAVTVITTVVVVGKVVGVSLGAFLTGHGVRTSVQAGMSLAQIGEFSFIIAGLGLTLGATGSFLYPVAVAVSAITTLTTPWLIRASGPVASFADRKLPRPLQTFATLYATWLARLREEPRRTSRGAVIRRLIRLLLLDMALLAALSVAASFALERLAGLAEQRLGLDADLARLGLIAAAFAIAVPLVAGVVRVARRLGFTLAEGALPAAAKGRVDLAAAPRRALVLALQLGIVLLTGLPLLAVTQPILGGVVAPALFALLLLILVVAFWRGAANLQGHVRAGAETIVEALVAHARRGAATPHAYPLPHRRPDSADALAEINLVLPGLGEPIALHLEPGSAAIGKSLADLNLRGVTGATVLAITRGERGVLVPSAKEVLQAGDVLALAGTQEAVSAARALLATPGAPSELAPAAGP
jgi:monovalent cation:H+ antiporter-2, CPA2 family